MFSYVDKSIRVQLEGDGRLVTLDREAWVVDANDAGAFISVLGPVPIPRLIGGEETMLEWYPFVRRTELSAVPADFTRAAFSRSNPNRSCLLFIPSVTPSV